MTTARVSSAVRWDATLQWRHGFYYVGAFVTIVWVALFSQLSKESLAYVLPPFLLLSLNVTTYYFVAGLVLFEKGEGILQGLVVTPLRTREYLLSKTATLTFLAVIESFLIVVLTYGLAFRVLQLITGMVFMSVIYTLIGFVMVVRYDSINEYLMPSFIFVTALQLPWFGYFGILESPLLYIIPTQAPLFLLKWAFHPLEVWQIVYAVGYSLIWIGISYVLAKRSFHHFVVKPRGGR